jgi:hypothetical protein
MVVEVGDKEMVSIEIDHSAMGLDGRICLYFQTKAELKTAVEWFRSHKEEQLAEHAKVNYLIYINYCSQNTRR